MKRNILMTMDLAFGAFSSPRKPDLQLVDNTPPRLNSYNPTGKGNGGDQRHPSTSGTFKQKKRAEAKRRARA